MAIGGAKYGLIDSVMSNTSNPATLAFLYKGQPVFNIEVSGRQSFFEANAQTSNSRVAYMRGLNFSIPFANRFGIGFGYRPTFSKGYRFNEYQVVEGDSLNRIYLGSG
jgi:hypothetical protein